MKKNHKRLLSSVLAGVMTLSMCSNALAAPVKAAAVDELVKAQEEAASKAPELLGSLDEMEVPALDDSVANQLPMTGYFSKTIEVGETKRTAKVYLADGIHIRDYFTVIAVPDGVDTEEFLTEGGWYAKADARNEGLFILEPGEGGWGTAEEEAAYVNAAIGFYASNKYFSIYGEHYFVGYGKGAAAMEYWAAANPLKVISQVYVDSEGLDAEYLEETGKTVFPTQTGSYAPIVFPEDFELLVYSDAVLPTWYIGGEAEDSLAYWKSVNDCEENAAADDSFGAVYHQKEDSTRWMTDYAGPISKVAVADAEAYTKELTDKICEFSYYYTRYENGFAYSNGLYERTFYDDSCFKVIDDVNGHPREYMVYEPENMQENSPVMFVFPGNTQTDLVFMDATQWQDVADKEGILLVVVCEDYNTATTVTFKDTNEFHEKLVEQIKKDYEGKVDPTRFYGNGQSMGGMTVQGFGSTNPEYFAAIATTSGCLMDAMSGDFSQRTYEMMPTYMIYGMGDNVNFGGTLWDETDNQLDDWARYYAAANGLKVSAVAEEDGVVTPTDRNNHRFQTTWSWTKDFDGVQVPLMQLGRNSARAHNCLPTEEAELYSFAKHFRVILDDNGNVAARYYSASAFAEDDQVLIYEAPKADPLQAQVTSIQATVGADFYGHKVNKVEITFAEGTDAKALAEAAFTVYDRGSANPEFGALNVADVKVEGNKVTLTMAMGSDKVTDRSRNSFGMMNKAGWYSDSEGNIYYGKETTIDALGHYIYPNTAGKTCQGRNLDLILCINGTDITKGIMSTDGCGNMLEDTVWEETEITGGLEKIVQEYVNVGWEAADYDQVSENGEVPVQVIYPEGYDVNRAEKYPVIVYQCGGGVCYWQISKDMEKGIRADANNLGTNTVYDNMMTEWAKEFPEAIVMAVNVHSSNTANAAKEIAGVLDYAIANWNVDADKIIGVGNSQGTIIFSDVIRQRSDLVAGYVECNGNFGTMASVANTDGTLANSSFGAWTAEEVQAMVDNEVAVWMFNGETDGDNPGVAQDTYKVYSDLFRAAGKSEQWIYDHVRVSGLQSWQFKEWGETDHSVTKVVAWKYIANPYNDPNSADEILPVGATYKFTGAEDYNKYEYTMDFDYTVYEESVAEWAKKLFAGEYEEAVVQEEQTITTKSDSYLLAYGHKPYSLKAKTTGDGELTFSSNNKKVATVDKNGKVTIVGTGKATITIKASETENYKAATKKVIIRVVPKKAALKDAVSPKKGQLKIAVKKDAMASGYMVQYATNKSFKGFKTVVLNKTSMTKVTIKGMKAGKYYVRVCAYKSIGGNKYIGAYSAAKTVKVK